MSPPSLNGCVSRILGNRVVGGRGVAGVVPVLPDEELQGFGARVSPEEGGNYLVSGKIERFPGTLWTKLRGRPTRPCAKNWKELSR